MGLFSTPKQQKAPAPTPVTPRLSDAELTAKAESDKLRKRRGIEDQILSLGRRSAGSLGVGDQQQSRGARLLGRTAA